MYGFSKPLAVVILITAFAIVWLSSHDLYASRINQQQHKLIQELRQGSYDLHWSLNASSDLVAGFGDGWNIQPKGLGLNTEVAEVSLAFNKRFIVPKYHQQLNFYWIGNHAATENTRIQLEFSLVDLGVFYYSPPIKLQLGLNEINLGRLIWTAKNGSQSSQINWQGLPPLNTLVWRFSQLDKKKNSAILRQVDMPQTELLTDIQQSSPLTAILSNQLRSQWTKQRFSLNLPPVMHLYLAISPWLLFTIGIVLLIAGVKLLQGLNQSRKGVSNPNSAIQVIALVAVITALMQTNVLLTVLERLPWLAIVMFILPTVLLIKRWVRPHGAAILIWLITFGFALVMFFLSDFEWTFIRDLPLYVLWALAQQVILGPLVSDYLHQKAGLSTGITALLCGVLFALLHVPNQMLMLATFCGGLLWSFTWLRYRNIYANAISHALLALLFYQAMPAHLLGTARVGFWF